MFMYSYCYVCALFCIFCFHRANWHSSATLTEVFPCFYSVVKLRPGYNSQRRGTACTLSKLIVLFYVLFVCKCVLYYCHRVTTQLQLTLRRLMSYIYIYIYIYIYMEHPFLMFLDHTQRRSTVGRTPLDE